MAFYGNGGGVLTNLITASRSHTNTSSDRSLSSSWVTHLSINSLTVPSGHRGIFDCFCYSYCRESEHGGAEFKFSHTGSSSADGPTSRFKRGYENNDGGDNSHYSSFHLGAGTYNFQWNAREWTGNIEMNREQNYDYFTVAYKYIRD